MHVRQSAADPEAVTLQIYEPPGVEVSSAFMKEVEKHFGRQEFRRSPWDGVGEIRYPAGHPRATPRTYSPRSTQMRSVRAGSAS